MKQQINKQAGAYSDLFSDEIAVTFFPAKFGTYKADLFGAIHSPSQFSQLSTVLDLMNEEDDLVLSINSGGGSLGAVDSLLHSMRKCRGHIHGIGTGEASSAASFVLLECDTYELSEGFEATLHCGSLGYGANFNEVALQAPFQLKHMESYLRRAYEGFLDEADLQAMFKGQDILLDAEGWHERAEKRQVYFENKIRTRIAEAEEAERIEQLALTSAPKPAKKSLKLTKKAVHPEESLLK